MSTDILDDLIKKHNTEIAARLNAQLRMDNTTNDLLAIEAIKEAQKCIIILLVPLLSITIIKY